jgi:hypothetical protein
MPEMTALQLATTDELVDELETRFHTTVIAATAYRSDHSYTVFRRFRGSHLEACGLIKELGHLIRRQFGKDDDEY